MQTYDMIAIGGGPGGYTAALYGARAGLRVVVMEKLSAGGQMALTHMIDNYPGYDEGIDGFASIPIQARIFQIFMCYLRFYAPTFSNIL